MTIDIRGLDEGYKRRNSGISKVTFDFETFDTDTILKTHTLPKNVIITDVFLVIDTPTNAGITFAVKAGATTILSARAASAAANTTYQNSAPKSLQRTGADITVVASATPTTGSATVIVKYVEFNRFDGEQTVIT